MATTENTPRPEMTPEQHRAAMDEALTNFIGRCRAHLLKNNFPIEDIGAAFSYEAVKILAEIGHDREAIADTLRTQARAADPGAVMEDTTAAGLLKVAIGEAERFGHGPSEIAAALRHLAEAVDAGEDIPSGDTGHSSRRH